MPGWLLQITVIERLCETELPLQSYYDQAYIDEKFANCKKIDEQGERVAQTAADLAATVQQFKEASDGFQRWQEIYTVLLLFSIQKNDALDCFFFRVLEHGGNDLRCNDEIGSWRCLRQISQ